MRSLLIICLIVGFLSCKHEPSNDTKARVLISNYLDSNIYYPGNYFPVSYDKLQVFTPESVEPPDLYVLTSEMNKLKNLNNDIYKSPGYNTNPALSEQLKKNKKKIAELDGMISVEKDDFSSIKDGWYIDHTYLAPNDFGTVIKQTNRFYFNRTLTKIQFVQSRLKKLPSWYLYVPVRYADNK